ncbi:RNA polymerase sigma factor [Gaoshiqia sp. Z1-71]|uniref:RNA polymerase sigma factor n=1 Tax=Gaoshiqia hydrogeniformans TaxID=3290090 RepID=UPI003BF86240
MANDLFITRYHKQKLTFNFFNTYVPNEKSLSPEDQLNYKELIDNYEKALRKMPEKQRVVFLLNRIDELKYKEIADQLGLSVKAVEKRMSLALEYLKEKLKDKIGHLVLFLFGCYFFVNKKPQNGQQEAT